MHQIPCYRLFHQQHYMRPELNKSSRFFMPKNQFQRMIFALLTVIVTVHAYVFYSLYVVNGNYFLSVEGASGVIDGIRLNGGVMALGSLLPIWAVILLEFCLAYILECVVGSPCSFKLACKVFDPEKTHPVHFA